MATIGLGCDNIGPFARPEVVTVSPSVLVLPAVAVAVVLVAVVVLVAAGAAVAAVAAVLGLLTGLEASSAKGGRRASLLERPGTVQRSGFDSVVDRRRPTSMGMGKNGAMDMKSVDVTDCCSAATSPAERTGNTAAMVLTSSSFEVRDV